MTYSSLSIQLYPGKISEDLASATAKSKTLAEIDHLAGRCGPYQLAAWAKAPGLTVHYVDNVWIRVPVSSFELIQFAAEILRTPEVVTLVFDYPASADGQYVIVAEEF
jgi:hypothetical protein